MRIYVINLAKKIANRTRIIALFDKLGITNYEIVIAIDGTELESYNVYNKWYDPRSHLHITKGEVGCALSHYTIWEKIEQSNSPMGMILEDDFVLNNEKEFCKFANYTDSAKFDLLYLGRKKMTNNKETPVNVTSVGLDELDLSKQVRIVINSGLSYWTLAYIISKSCASKLKNTFLFSNQSYKDNIFPVDEYIPWVFGTNTIYGLDNNTPNTMSYLALEPSIVKPKSNAFLESGTYFSEQVPVYNDECILITVGTENNDCVKRYRQSCLKYGFNPIILGLDTNWNGGDMSAGQGGGQKINFLKAYLKDLYSNKLLIFTDSYDVICNDHMNLMIETYKSKFNKQIVFGAETSCWPDTTLAENYPLVDVENKYLNSGNFIGWSDDIKKILELPIENSADDQLYYTHRFLESLNHDIDTPIVLDYDNDLFFCLNGATNIYILEKSKSCIMVKNKRPTFIHGNGPPSIKRELNYIGNYICGGYNSTYGYKNMNKLETLPKILIIFEEFDDPADVVFEKFINLDYPRELIQFIYIYENAANILLLNAFSKISLIQKTDISLVDTVDTISNNVDYVFYLTSRAILENKNTLKRLVEENKDIIGPLLVKPGCLFSNFWGDISGNNFYKRSKNYFDIINNNERGCWNISYIWEALLIKADLFTKNMLIENKDKGDGIDMAFCYNIRKTNRFMYVLNTEKFGYYSESERLSLTSFESNKLEWEKKYIDNDFRENNTIEEIGVNIHKIKIFTKIFCEELIQKAEKVNKWSQGGKKHYDKRISNTENHPTQDIHMNELGLEDMWKFIVDTYIKPIVWNEYKYDTKNINISFIVKYSMDGQKELEPHHDSSAYSVNLCLNNDFEGGGCHFIRKNQSVINKDIGSVIIHPGRITHYHQGLPITAGTRYILVSFIN